MFRSVNIFLKFVFFNDAPGYQGMLMTAFLFVASTQTLLITGKIALDVMYGLSKRKSLVPVYSLKLSPVGLGYYLDR